MQRHIRATSLAFLSLLAACADQPTTPAVAPDADAGLARGRACVARPTVVVSTQAQLRAAVASATSGDVIAISGTIALDTGVAVTTPGVTITCAERGAGLELSPTSTDVLLELMADSITISGLRLDAEGGLAPILALAITSDGMAGIRITGNEVECSPEYCIFAASVPGIQVTDNRFHGDRTRYGLHIQGVSTRLPDGSYADGGAVISRNVVETENANPGLYGAIRVRDGLDVTIAHNDVLGPWSNGVVLTNLYDSRVEHNRIEGALRAGIDFPLIVSNRITASGLSIRANRIEDSGIVGIAVRAACYNTFQGNRVKDNPLGARFEVNTGANTYQGSTETVVNLGAFDCDLDGDVDPNQFSGGVQLVGAAAVAGPSPSAAAAEPVVHRGIAVR